MIKKQTKYQIKLEKLKKSKKLLTKIKKTLKYTSLAEQNGKAKTKKFFNNESRQSVWALASTLSEAKKLNE